MTDSTEEGSLYATNNISAGQEIPSARKPEYPLLRSEVPCVELSMHVTSVHNNARYAIQIYFNSIISSKPRFANWTLYLFLLKLQCLLHVAPSRQLNE